MLEPIPASTVVAEAYARLAVFARAEGVTLRRLQREPVFGGLVKDLLAVERALEGSGDTSTILRLDERLRTIHRERLNQLCALGPRCQLDAASIQRWIAAVEAQLTGKQEPWTVPALEMSDLSLAFPIDEAALFQIFANLLRNAEAAASLAATPKILVSLGRETDFTGQPLVKLKVGDNAPGDLSEERLESQEPGRGLGIIRDTARDWHGRVVLSAESEPYRKSIGVQFAL
jgi:C4-dicarboxylate-specific signal transduction histidine kinase